MRRSASTPDRSLDELVSAVSLQAPGCGALAVDLRASVADGASCRFRGAASVRLERRLFDVLAAATEALQEARPAPRTLTLDPEHFRRAGFRSCSAVAAADDHGWHTLLFVSCSNERPPPAPRRLLKLVQRRPAPPGPLHRALAALTRRFPLPAALVHEGRLGWVAPDLWPTLGVPGETLGQLCIHPTASLAAARIEACARGAKEASLAAVQLDEATTLVHATDAGPARRAASVRRATAELGLSRVDRLELDHLLSGLSSKEAATRDGVSVETSRERRRQLYRKSGVSGAGRLRAFVESL